MQRSKISVLGDNVPVLVLVTVFLLAAAILLEIFSASWVMSREAKGKNDAVTLCRSAAEVFSGDPAALADGPYFFDEMLRPGDTGIYRMEITVEEEQTPYGTLETAEICVYQGETCLYTLEKTAYRPEVTT